VTLNVEPEGAQRCHGLVPWSLTLAATQNPKTRLQMPRACPVEFSRSLLFSWEREASTAQGRGIQIRWLEAACSSERDTPRDKPVASFVMSQFELTPKALANFSPGLERSDNPG